MEIIITRKRLTNFICISLTFVVSFCSELKIYYGSSKKENLVLKTGNDDSNYVELSKIKNNYWMHTTYGNFKGSRIGSNGLVIVSDQEVILIDTPWNDNQTEELMKLVKRSFNKKISVAIITHAHNDRMGGIKTLFKNNVEVLSIGLTKEKINNNQKIKEIDKKEHQMIIDGIGLEIYYPGEGHSEDNITVWFSNDNILFGGCLVKSLEAKDMGNISDANIEEWEHSVEKVFNKYRSAEFVIPGHGKWGNLDLLRHTIKIVKK